MDVTEFKPYNQLSSYIDSYWNATCKTVKGSMDTITPDGCVDIIINLGEDYYIDTADVILKSEKVYLGGAITHFMKAKTQHGTHIAGVRFKPAAFSCFYPFSSLHEVTNHFIELDKNCIPDINSLFADISAAFDSFFSERLIQPEHLLLPVVDYIKNCKGRVSVHTLAKMYCTTVRQLERNFKYYIGLSPKEFINIIRYKFAHQLIKTQYPERTLFDIAFESGYYDHAHLSNEIKKYTGVSPTGL